MKVIIPIAGEGRRLRPHTHTRQKSMVPVAGKPMIDHVIDQFTPLSPSEFVFIVGYQRERFEKYLRKEYPDLNLRFVVQEVPLGTAHATGLGLDGSDEDIIVDFGDTLFEADLSVTKNCKADAIIWAQHREDYQRFGVILTDADGNMTKIVEKPKEPISKLANIGLHWFGNMPLLREAIEHTIKNKPTDREAYLTDSLQYMIEKGAKIKVLTADAWHDCGTPEALLEANEALLRTKSKPVTLPGCSIIAPVAIDPTAVIHGSTIGPNVSIGPGAEINGSVIKNSIIDAKAKITDSLLTDSIVGEEAVVRNQSLRAIIGDHSRVE